MAESKNANTDSKYSNTLKAHEVIALDKLDEQMGFFRYVEGPGKLGWLMNMHEVRSSVGSVIIDLRVRRW